MRNRRSGFTLIELLVVVAIIALLIGILLPALGSAQRSAKSVKSLSNLRSLGQIQAVYAGEFRDSLINPFDTTQESSGGLFGGGWGSVRKPTAPGIYVFGDSGKWYSEMYAFHWYSLVGGWLSEGDYASEIQFAPLDKILIQRVNDLWYEAPNFNLNTGIWDSSYVLSPTAWFSAERYRDDPRPNAYGNSGPRSMARRNRMSDVTFPSQKALMWERFDWNRRDRQATIFNPFQSIGGINTDFGKENLSPQWNNPDAEPGVASVDGSVTRVSIQSINDLTQSDSEITKRVFTPTDMWNMPYNTLRRYSMHEDGFEIGNPNSGYGQYPAYFWATRDGIRGRDFQR
jgi:prepilin-type N-terminal cleavage/methylation domain-containing protein